MSDAEPAVETFTIPWRGRQLAARTVEPPGPIAASALVLHGWTGSSSGSSLATARALAGVGVRCLVPDLPGHGASDGDRLACTRDEFLDAARRAWDALPGAPLALTLLVGTSFGGHLAAQLTAMRRVDALALRVPADYPDDTHGTPLGELMGEEHAALRHAWLDQRRGPRATASLRAVASFDGPVFVQQAANDQVIPARTVRNYLDAAAGRGGPNAHDVTFDLIDGAPHALGTDKAVLRTANAALLAWVRGVLARPAPAS